MHGTKHITDNYETAMYTYMYAYIERERESERYLRIHEDV